MPDPLDFGGPTLKRTVAIAVLIYFAVNAFGYLPSSLAGEVFGIQMTTIAGALAAICAYWLMRKLAF